MRVGSSTLSLVRLSSTSYEPNLHGADSADAADVADTADKFFSLLGFMLCLVLFRQQERKGLMASRVELGAIESSVSSSIPVAQNASFQAVIKFWRALRIRSHMDQASGPGECERALLIGDLHQRHCVVLLTEAVQAKEIGHENVVL